MSDTIRTVKKNNYRMMSIIYLTDKRLSWLAKGVMTALLAFSGEYTMSEMISFTSEGKSDARIGLAELEQFGYVKKFQRGDETEYRVYEESIVKVGIQDPDPIAEISYEEDVPGKTLIPEYSVEEEQLKLREKFNLRIVSEKCSERFVELVFREMCRREADFREMMTAQAFEMVCLTAWERQRQEQISGSYEFSALINKYFDSVVLGIRSASGGNGKMETKFKERRNSDLGRNVDRK